MGIPYNDQIVINSNNLYFMKAMLETTFTGFTGLTGVNQKIPNFIEQFNGINPYYGDLDEVSQEWLCRDTGFYRVNILLVVQSATVDELRAVFIQTRLTEDGTPAIIAQGGCDHRGQGSEGHIWTIQSSILHYIKAGSKIDFLFNWIVDDGVGLSITNTITHFDIAKIY